jgi:hypothetical protein
VEDLVRTAMRLRLRKINQGLNQLRFLQEDLQDQGELRLETYRDLFMQYTQTKSRLDHALGEPLQLD